MKTFKLFAIIFFASIIPIATNAGWSDPDKGYFKYQKDVEKDVSYYSNSSSTIFFDGALYNFINYEYSSNKVIVRKLTTKNDKISWSVIKVDDYQNLTSGLYSSYWQPAPIVFDDSLHLFLVKSDGTIGYSVYNPTLDTWSKIRPGPSGCNGEFLAAVMVVDKLCLIAHDKSTGKASIYWTTDLATWKHAKTQLKCGTFQYYDNIYYSNHISAITKSWVDNDGTLKSKIMVSYIPADMSVRVAQFAFYNADSVYQVCDELVANEFTYNSAALAEGTVMGDPSTGNCTQIFLRKATKDNGYCRYRILRYQKSEGGSGWTKRENNLVPQNKLWADHDLDITAVNYPFLDGDELIRQYMVLVYRGYDDYDHPLNCAWAETDCLHYIISKHVTLDDPEDLQYVGYIEGPPPYFLNPASVNYPNDLYCTGENNSISELEYANTTVVEQADELAVEINRSVKLKVSGFNAGLSYATGSKSGNESELTETASITVKASESPHAYYICFAIDIFADEYDVYDVNGNKVYTVYDFHLEEEKRYPIEPIRAELIPGNPGSYMDSVNSYPFSSYQMFDHESFSWSNGLSTKSSVETKNSTSTSSIRSGSAEIGLDFGEVLDLGIEGSFDFSHKVTTMTSNEITCHCRMNACKIPYNDVSEIDYIIYWLKRTGSKTNWWLNESCQETNQQPWCLTYLVTRYVLWDGTTIVNPDAYNGLEDDADLTRDAMMIQNRPNPFSSFTTITYKVDDQGGKGGHFSGQMTSLSVYDFNGRLVTNLVNETKAPGTYEVTWDASSYPAGIYLCRMQTDDVSYVRKLVVSR
jgi:hypothetical protein